MSTLLLPRLSDLKTDIGYTYKASVYGDVFSVKVMNQTIIVINTPTLVREVIDKNGLSSINRPKSILADMITPDNMNMGTGRFGGLI